MLAETDVVMVGGARTATARVGSLLDRLRFAALASGWRAAGAVLAALRPRQGGPSELDGGAEARS